MIDILGATDELRGALPTRFDPTLWGVATVCVALCAFGAVRMLWQPVEKNDPGTGQLAAWLLLSGGIWAAQVMTVLGLRFALPVHYGLGARLVALLPALGAAGFLVVAVAADGRTRLERGALCLGAALCMVFCHVALVAGVQVGALLRYPLATLPGAVVGAAALLWMSLDGTDRARARGLAWPPVAAALGVSLATLGVAGLCLDGLSVLATVAPGSATASPAFVSLAFVAAGLLIASLVLPLRRANGRLQRVARRVDVILGTTQQGYVVVDAEGVIIDHNPGLLRLLARRGENLVGASARQLLGEIDTSEGGEDGREVVLRRRDGTTLACLMHAALMNDPGDDKPVWLGIFSDISGRVEAEARVRASEQGFLALLDSSPDPMLIVSAAGLVTLVNKSAERFFGGDREVLLGTPAERWLPAGVHRRLHRLVSERNFEATSALMIGTQTLEAVRLSGERVPVEVSLSPIETSEGLVVATTLRDVSQRVAASNALKRQLALQEEARETLARANDEQQAIFEAVALGIVMLSRSRIVSCNPYAEKIMGATAGASMGSTVRSWFPDDASYRRVRREVLAALTDGRSYESEIDLVRVGGERFHARLRTQAVRSGAVESGLVAVIEDITDQRAATSRLMEAKELAEQAARTKATFLANMSHEIRTPMNAIIGMAHLLLRTELTDRQREFARTVHRSGNHLLGILNDILDLSKIEAGRVVLEAIDFELDAVLEQAVALIGESAAAKHIEVLLDVDAAVPPRLRGDPGRVGQILINYLNNAVKFTDHGEVRVAVTRVEESGAGTVLRFAVSDTGIGIDVDQVPKLFRNFEQADPSTTRRYGGTGLGLSIARNIATLMGGEVGVDTLPGEGSTFWCTVRLAHPREEAPPQRVLAAGEPILIVDDHAAARMIVARYAERLGFRVTTADSAATGLEHVAAAAAAGEPFLAVLIDRSMPGLDGVAMLRRLVNSPQVTRPRTILLTGPGHAGVIADARGPVADANLPKPVTLSTLTGVLRDVLSGQGAHQGEDVPTPLALEGVQVLVVEDNPVNQQVTLEILREAGCIVKVASNGALAVELVRTQRFDAVLMDVQMPVMDGLEATRRIRRLVGRDKLPIIAVTANVLGDNREACFAAGMDDHISKPVLAKTLWAAIARWTRRVSVVGEGEEPLRIDGLDTARGLRQSLGRRAMYLDLLRKFSAGYRGYGDQLREAALRDDVSELREMVRSLAGVVGSIGATRVGATATACAAELERDLSISARCERADELALDLERLLVAVGRHFGEPQPAPMPQQVAQTLCDLLAAGDYAALAYLDRHDVSLRAILGGAYEGVRSAVLKYDFNAAVALVRGALSAPTGAAVQRFL